MRIYLAGSTGKTTGMNIFKKGIGRLISYYDLLYADRAFYSGYEVEWYIGKKIVAEKREEKVV